MKLLTESEVIKEVQDCLNEHQPVKFRLSVVPEAMRRDDDWWYVTVVPDPPSVRSYDYAAVLTEVEELIRDRTGAKVLLVPTLASD